MCTVIKDHNHSKLKERQRKCQMSTGLTGDPDYNGPTNKKRLCVGM